MLYPLIRKVLFSMPPEAAHEFVLEGLRAGNLFGAPRLLGSSARLPCRVMGLEFTNPVGLAAGMDKNGDYVDALGALGFGFIEVGTVTPRPQPGNPKPRVFRLPQHEAMINRLGFNNKGVDHLVERVSQRRWKGVLGINIGKNFDTPIERAADDYRSCLEKVYLHADYVTVNISSPNTEGLRSLQETGALGELLAALAASRARLADTHGRCVPLAVKLAPDLEDPAIPRVAEVIAEHRIDGVIATNTTIARDGVAGAEHAGEAGGLSGAPLRPRADAVLEQLRAALPPEIALIGTGGITRGSHAARKIALGAELVQFYTGFVYRGPDLVGECVNAIRTARAASQPAA